MSNSRRQKNMTLAVTSSPPGQVPTTFDSGKEKPTQPAISAADHTPSPNPRQNSKASSTPTKSWKTKRKSSEERRIAVSTAATPVTSQVPTVQHSRGVIKDVQRAGEDDLYYYDEMMAADCPVYEVL